MDQPAPSDDAFTALEAERLVAKLGGDKELLLEIIALFQREAPALMQALRDTARSGDASEIAKAAHVLKGSAANFGVNPLYELSRAIENHARSGDLSTLEEQMARFEPVAAGFLRALKRMEREVRP